MPSYCVTVRTEVWEWRRFEVEADNEDLAERVAIKRLDDICDIEPYDTEYGPRGHAVINVEELQE